MLSAEDLRRVFPTLPRIVMRGPWYRAVAFDYLLGPPPRARVSSPVQPLWPGGAPSRGARFTPKRIRATGKTKGKPSFDSLYLAGDEMTPLLEVTGVLKPPNSPIPLIFEPQVLMTVDGVLTDIIDLTDNEVMLALKMDLQTLTGDWIVQQEDYLAENGPMPPTQMLGQAAYDVGGIVGLKYRSSRNVADAIGIVVFPDRLVTGKTYLELFNRSTGALQQRLP